MVFLPNPKLIALKEKKHIEHLKRVNEIKSKNGFVSVTTLQPFFNEKSDIDHNRKGGTNYA